MAVRHPPLARRSRGMTFPQTSSHPMLLFGRCFSEFGLPLVPIMVAKRAIRRSGALPRPLPKRQSRRLAPTRKRHYTFARTTPVCWPRDPAPVRRYQRSKALLRRRYQKS